MPRLSDLLPRDEASSMRPNTSRSQFFGLPQVEEKESRFGIFVSKRLKTTTW